MQIRNNADFAKAYPILTRLLTNGTIKIINGEYVGLASDGVEVLIGSIHDEVKHIESYLTARPTPDMW